MTTHLLKLRCKTLSVWMVLLGTVFFIACQKERIPSDLVDIWGSTDGRYRGCYFELTNQTLVFGRADLSVESFTIKSVVAAMDPDVRRYAITAINQRGVPITVELHYMSRDGGSIRFGNQPEVQWQRFRGPF